MFLPIVVLWYEEGEMAVGERGGTAYIESVEVKGNTVGTLRIWYVICDNME